MPYTPPVQGDPNWDVPLNQALEDINDTAESALSAVNNHSHFMFAYKTVDESLSSTTTVQDDNELFVSVEANTKYFVDGFIRYRSETSADLAVSFSVPSGATFDYSVEGLSSSVSVTVGDVYKNRLDASTRFGIGGVSGADVVCTPVGVLSVGGTSGIFRFRWAQDVSNATATIVRAGSVLRLVKIS